MKNKLLILIIPSLILTSCVSMQKYKDLESRYNESTQKTHNLEKKNLDQGVLINELNAKLEQEKTRLAKLQNQYDEMEAEYQLASTELEQLRKDYDELQQKYATNLAGNRSETQKLLKELNELRENLMKREADLADKQKSLDKLMADFQAKEKKVLELQSILDRKDQELAKLRDKVMEALMGFKDKGLSVHTKNGKVYVSMDEKLLFASGSWQVGDVGKQALAEVRNVLVKNPDINIMIEGHTDNVRFSGRGDIKDNWDLSVMRATSIVKILTQGESIQANRITAAGRGEYAPLIENNSPENKAKNRRTEIILTPKLDELLNILERN